MKIFLDTDSIFTLATKHLMIIKKYNLYLHLKSF